MPVWLDFIHENPPLPYVKATVERIIHDELIVVRIDSPHVACIRMSVHLMSEEAHRYDHGIMMGATYIIRVHEAPGLGVHAEEPPSPTMSLPP